MTYFDASIIFLISFRFFFDLFSTYCVKGFDFLLDSCSAYCYLFENSFRKVVWIYKMSDWKPRSAEIKSKLYSVYSHSWNFLIGTKLYCIYISYHNQNNRSILKLKDTLQWIVDSFYPKHQKYGAHHLAISLQFSLILAFLNQVRNEPRVPFGKGSQIQNQ